MSDDGGPANAVPGIARLGDGHGSFHYQLASGARVRDPADLERIRRLAIPPAWADVWISQRPAARLQATGRDARGRKQYRYHPDFRRAREAAKYANLAEFGRVLPRLRRQVDRDLRRRGLPREKVLATVVALLEATRIRIGNREYAEANHSYGLTTLRPQQVFVDGGAVRLVFRGKSGRRHRVVLEDRRLARLVARCRATPGRELFQYAASDGTWVPVHSDDVNSYLRDVTRADITAKSIRTWSASVLALRLLRNGRRSDETRSRSVLGAAIRSVAETLGNTPAVSRASYVHPGVIAWYEAGEPEPGPSRRGAPWLSPDERRFIVLLGQTSASPRRRATT
jgi:DNA topoisomerase-1